MDNETIIRLAKEAGMLIHEGAQDRVLFDGSIVDSLARFAELVLKTNSRNQQTNTFISFEGAETPEISLYVPSEVQSDVIGAIKAAFVKGQELGANKVMRDISMAASH